MITAQKCDEGDHVYIGSILPMHAKGEERTVAA